MENSTTQSQITINDLITLKDLVDLACSRGAFRAPEMTAIGEVYDKLTSFLDTVITSTQSDANQQGEAQND